MKKYKKDLSTTVLIALSSVFIILTVIYGIIKLQDLRIAQKSGATSPVGDFIGICPNQKVAGQIYVKYETFDNSITRIEFSLDNTPVRTEQLYPYALAGNAEDSSHTIFPFDTKSLSDGQHTLRAKIITASGEYNDSVNFTIANNNITDTYNQFQGICNNQTVNGQMWHLSLDNK